MSFEVLQITSVVFQTCVDDVGVVKQNIQVDGSRAISDRRDAAGSDLDFLQK
jgi:hypothetical protein